MYIVTLWSICPEQLRASARFSNFVSTVTVSGPVGKHQWDVTLVELITGDFSIVSFRRSTLKPLLTQYPADFRHHRVSHPCNASFHQTHLFPLILSSLSALKMASNIGLYRSSFDMCLLRSGRYYTNRACDTTARSDMA